MAGIAAAAVSAARTACSRKLRVAGSYIFFLSTVPVLKAKIA